MSALLRQETFGPVFSGGANLCFLISHFFPTGVQILRHGRSEVMTGDRPHNEKEVNFRGQAVGIARHRCLVPAPVILVQHMPRTQLTAVQVLSFFEDSSPEKAETVFQIVAQRMRARRTGGTQEGHSEGSKRRRPPESSGSSVGKEATAGNPL